MRFTPELAEYIIYLPLCYNNGSKIEEEKIEMTLKEIREKFGTFTRERANEGVWIYKSKQYNDLIDKIQVLIYNTKENDKWFENFKLVLKKRFNQKEIFITKMKGVEIL